MRSLALGLSIFTISLAACTQSAVENDGKGDGGNSSSHNTGGASKGTGGKAGSGGSGGDGSTATSLCDKYGGESAVATVVQKNVIGAIAGDCRINTFFTTLSETAFTRVHDCLTIQVQELFGCEGIHYVGSQDSNGKACRDMKTAHRGSSISDADFDALIEDVVAGLQEAGVEQEDIEAAAPALLGLRGDVVEVKSTENGQDKCENGGGAGGGMNP